jgi:hypothetical protein
MPVGHPIPDVDHVVRYVKPSSIEADGTINGSEFRLRPNRPDDVGVSVSWMESYDPPPANQISEVRQRSRLKTSKSGCYARMNVGRTRKYVLNESQTNLAIVHDPLQEDGTFVEDGAHSIISGLPPGDSPEAEAIGDLIAECIDERYPAIIQKK